MTGKSEIACRGACGLGSANLAIGWLMDNHEQFFKLRTFRCVVRCMDRESGEEKKTFDENETIGSLFKSRSMMENKNVSVENLIRNLLGSLKDYSELLTSSSESVEMLLSFMKHPMFQNKNDKILINAVSACLSNLQEDETLSIKLWNELAEMNLVSLKVLDRVSPSLDMLESFLEEKNIREEVALHMIDAITRRRDFRVRIYILYISTQITLTSNQQTDTTSPDILCKRKQISLCCGTSFDCDEISSERRSEYVDI